MIKKLFIVAGIVIGILYLVLSNKSADMIQKYIDSHQSAKWAPEAQFKLASVCFFTMRYKKSLTSYEILRARYPSHHGADEALFRIASCYENFDDTELAVAKYKEFIDLYPGHLWETKAYNHITNLTLLK